ncbi:hypothetical protein [Vibrio quintilis]|uniref:Uncharacterized protein n=1 Tax=Vibrio quintilis TaxID=1117707 RepID=A0A1M7YZ56_9VIBR|nr:hypothetical protein [Vibrio quintilis]SHO57938.1 hypothetical protein VQ7734_03708 [Vibrio quintilis]
MTYYAETAWKGQEPENYELEEVDRSQLIPVPKSVAYTIAAAQIICIFSFIGAIYSLFIYAGESFRYSGLLIAGIIFFALSFISYQVIKRLEKDDRIYAPKYPYYIAEHVQKFIYTRLQFKAPSTIVPTHTLKQMEFKPSVWNERRFKDKYGKAVIEWDEKTLTEYRYIMGISRRILKFFWYANFPYTICFSWAHVVNIVTSHSLLNIHPLILILNIALLFSGKSANTGWTARRKVIEFNRITGKVTGFDDQGEPSCESLFTDFNAYIHYEPGRFTGKTTTPSHHGLELVPRHKPFLTPKDTIKLYTFGGTAGREYCDELWKTLVVFMDVTKPLPFSIVLETCRHNDPTSREYQLMHPEEIPSFTSMTDKEYQNSLKDFYARQTIPSYKKETAKMPKEIKSSGVRRGREKRKHRSKKRRR